MKKINAFITALLVTSMLTACNNVGTTGVTETSTETEESVTTVSEETTLPVSEATETTDETTETTTVETTVVTEIQSALSEDIYGLDSAKSIEELNRGTLPENNIPYMLWQGFRKLHTIITQVC